MAYTEILNKAYDLADEIKQSHEYKEMLRLNEVIKSEYKEILKNYHKTFEKFDEVLILGGKYHPDFKKVSKAYQEAKIELYEKEEVKTYFKYERKINELLKEISDEIFSSVSKYYKEGGSCSWL